MAELNFSGYHPTMTHLVLLAKELGWHVTQQDGGRKGRGGTRLRSPVSAKTISIPRSTQIRDSVMKSLYHQVATHSDHDRLVDVIAAMRAITDPDFPQEMTEMIAREFVPTIASVAEGETVQADRNPPIVTRRPWLARRESVKGGVRQYESNAVVEVLHDGEVDHYECSVPGCGFVSDNPRSVSNHYGATKDPSHTHGQERETVAVLPEERVRRAYDPTERLVRLLSHVIMEFIEAGGQTFDTMELARAILVWQHERPDLPDPERQTEPLDAEAKLERIRQIVVGTDFVDLRAENDRLASELAEAREAASTATSDAADARHRLDEVESNLAALEEIIGSLRKHE